MLVAANVRLAELPVLMLAAVSRNDIFLANMCVPSRVPVFPLRVKPSEFHPAWFTHFLSVFNAFCELSVRFCDLSKRSNNEAHPVLP